MLNTMLIMSAALTSRLNPRSCEFVEAKEHIRLSVASPDVFGAGQPLLEKAEQIRAGLAGGRPVRDGDVAQQCENGESHDDDAQHRTSCSPVFTEKHRKDSEHEEDVA